MQKRTNLSDTLISIKIEWHCYICICDPLSIVVSETKNNVIFHIVPSFQLTAE